MNTIHFPEANVRFGPPSDLDESQCQTIHAFSGRINGGSCDGAAVVVTAWKPSPDDLARLVNGEPIYLSCIGGLPPHFLTTDFHSAIHPQ